MKNVLKKKRNIPIVVLTFVCILVFVIGISYAYIRYTTRQSGINTLQSDCVRVEMQELTNAINLVDVYPVIDMVGEKTKPFQFKLTNTCGVGVNYNLNLEVMETESRIASKNIAVKVDDLPKSILNTNTVAEPTYNETDYRGVEAYTLKTGELNPSASVTHEIRLWLDESAGNDAQKGKFYSKVVIQSNQTQTIAVPINDVSIGDYIAYTPSSTSYTISTTLTGNGADQTINPSELNLWRVIRKNSDGTVEVVSEYVSSTDVTFYGQTGFAKLVGSLNEIAKQYETEGITVASRHMGYNGQTLTSGVVSISNRGEWTTNTPRPTSFSDPISPTITNGDSRESAGGGDYGYLTDYVLVKTAIGKLGTFKSDGVTGASYWLASRFYHAMAGCGPCCWRECGNLVTEDGGFGDDGLAWNGTCNTGGMDQTGRPGAIRPIVLLKSDTSVIRSSLENGGVLWSIFTE